MIMGRLCSWHFDLLRVDYLVPASLFIIPRRVDCSATSLFYSPNEERFVWLPVCNDDLLTIIVILLLHGDISVHAHMETITWKPGDLWYFWHVPNKSITTEELQETSSRERIGSLSIITAVNDLARGAHACAMRLPRQLWCALIGRQTQLTHLDNLEMMTW